MGTSWSVRAVLPRQGKPPDVQALVQAALDAVVAEMSNWEAASDISRFNRREIGSWQSLPPAFAHVLAAGLDIARRSHGAFDPAIGHAVDRWGFGPGFDRGGTSQTPEAPWTRIEQVGAEARRLADVALDFSGIAKGYGVDAAADALKQAGIAHFLVEVGGELRGQGVKPDGQPWWVDLEVPPHLQLAPARVALCGLSVATSGDYRRYRIEDGRRLSHSIDPGTGAPVAHPIASVTVIHPSCMLADAWATAILVAGVEKGLGLAEAEGLAVQIVERNGQQGREHLSPAFQAMLA